MIHYNIDTTENEYCNIEGDVETLIELKQILFKNDMVPDLVGYLSFDNSPNVSVCISAQKELGFFISITDDENTYLTLGDKNILNESTSYILFTIVEGKIFAMTGGRGANYINKLLNYFKLKSKVNRKSSFFPL